MSRPHACADGTEHHTHPRTDVDAGTNRDLHPVPNTHTHSFDTPDADTGADGHSGAAADGNRYADRNRDADFGAFTDSDQRPELAAT